jgi:magnesium chelatase subunit I
MSEEPNYWILPYSRVVGQGELKLALELSYIAPGIGGVLISGQRGTAKSTAVRAFCMMMNDDGELPVTLPINATDDRVVGGWRLDKLMLDREPVPQPGLLQKAGDRGELLYIDEVNLLEDHIVNIILDAAAAGVLTVERESRDEEIPVKFAMVATMNPEEGQLRPQLLDRFGLMVEVTGESDVKKRQEILRSVLLLDEARYSGKPSQWLDKGREGDWQRRDELKAARGRLYDVSVQGIMKLCAEIAAALQAPGHRGDAVMVLAARALAALDPSRTAATPEDVGRVAQLALQHRRTGTGPGGQIRWDDTDKKLVDKLVRDTRSAAQADADAGRQADAEPDGEAGE